MTTKRQRSVAWALVLLCNLALGTLAAERPPNIIFILADDLGYGDIGAFGQKKIRTRTKGFRRMRTPWMKKFMRDTAARNTPRT